MKLRKLLAVLSAVFMLCTVLPLSGLVCTAADVSYDGYFYNGDFEADTANWTMHNDTDTVTEVVTDNNIVFWSNFFQSDVNFGVVCTEFESFVVDETFFFEFFQTSVSRVVERFVTES